MTTHIKDDFGNDWYFEDAQHHVTDETGVTTGDPCRDALQSIITWADFAMKNKDEFDSHGVSLLDGPIFDKARAALASPSPQPNVETRLPEGQWGWWAGRDEECFTVGPCETREDAICEATSECLGETNDSGEWKLNFCVIEAKQDPLAFGDWIDFDKMIERAEESLFDSDRVGEEDDSTVFDISTENQADLEVRLKRVCIEWQLANNLHFKTSLFSHQRNKEFVTVDHPNANELAAPASEGSADA